MYQAVDLANSDKLTSALKFLKEVSPEAMVPHEVASFLYHNDSFDKSQVGDLLGGLEDSLFIKSEYDALRAAFLQLMDFTSLAFEQALRLFLCESNFRLPGEAQKIDRILEAFCAAYCKDNPGMFRAQDSAFVLCFALIMLNTDLHDSRIDHKHIQKMTLEQFIKSLESVEAFPEGEFWLSLLPLPGRCVSCVTSKHLLFLFFLLFWLLLAPIHYRLFIAPLLLLSVACRRICGENVQQHPGQSHRVEARKGRGPQAVQRGLPQRGRQRGQIRWNLDGRRRGDRGQHGQRGG